MLACAVHVLHALGALGLGVNLWCRHAHTMPRFVNTRTQEKVCLVLAVHVLGALGLGIDLWCSHQKVCRFISTCI